MNTIEIDDNLYKYIASQTKVIGESAGDILRRLLNPPESNSKPIADDRTSDEVSKFIDSLNPQVLRFKPPVEKLLYILGQAAKHEPDTFEKVLNIQGRVRRYFARSEQEITRSGASTQPKQIPGTDYWVMTNSSTSQKSLMLRQALEIIGFSNKVAKAAAKEINRSHLEGIF